MNTAEIKALQRRVEQLERQIGALAARNPQSRLTLQKKLMRTKADGIASYPSAGSGPNTYPAEHVRATFTKAQGAQSVSVTSRGGDKKRYVRNIATGSVYVPENTLIEVLSVGGHEFFSWGANGTQTVFAQLNGTLARGGQQGATVTHGPTAMIGNTITVFDRASIVKNNLASLKYVAASSMENDTSKWYIHWAEQDGSGGAEPTLFKLTADLSLGGTANAESLKWNSTTNVYEVISTITVRDAHGKFFWGKSGDYGFAHLRTEGPRDYEIIFLEHKAHHIRGTLTNPMGYTTAGQTTATVDWYGDGYNPDPTPSGITIYDALNNWTNAPSGAKFTATLNSHNGLYEIDVCEHVPRLLLCTCTQTFSRTADSVAATIVSKLDRGWVKEQASNNITLWNPVFSSGYLFEGANGHIAIAAYDQTTNKYWMVGVWSGTNASFTQVTVVTDVNYDETTGSLRKKTRSVGVDSPGAESAFVNITTAEDC